MHSSLSGKVVEDLGDERVCDPRLVLLVRDAHADEAVAADVAVAHVLVLLHALPLRQGSPLGQDLVADSAEAVKVSLFYFTNPFSRTTVCPKVRYKSNVPLFSTKCR